MPQGQQPPASPLPEHVMPIRLAGSRCLRFFQPSSQLPGPAWPGCLYILHKALFLWRAYKAHAQCPSPPGWQRFSARAGRAGNELFIALCPHLAAPRVRAWVGETGSLVFPVGFGGFFSLFTGRIALGHAVAAGRLPCVSLFEER